MTDNRSKFEKGVGDMVERYFEGRAYIGLSDVATLLGVSTKTVKRHVDVGAIRFSRIGHGRRKIRRAFTVTDVVAFCLRAAGIDPVECAASVRTRPVPPPRRIRR